MPENPVLLTHRVNADPRSQVAIVFLHGFSGDIAKTWGQFPQLLKAEPAIADWDLYSAGFKSSLVPDVTGIWSSQADLPILADLLRAILGHLPLDRYRSLAIIAHSMGGLVAQRALVDDSTLTERVGHVFLFGTPSRGLVEAAWLRFWKQQFAEMAPNSLFLRDLENRWRTQFEPAPPFRFFAIAGEEDQFVPPESSIDTFPFEQRQVVPGNHHEIVKPTGAQSLSVQVVLKALIGEACPAGPWNAARVALEARDFQRAIHELLPHQEELDDSHLVILALALESVGRREDAITALEKRAAQSTDALGVLGGRLKRRWLISGRAADAERARLLYGHGLERAEAAEDWAQAFYHAINLAFLNLGQEDRKACHEMARRALDYVEKSQRDEDPNHWSLATEGEACLYLGDPDRAIRAYKAALALDPSPREIASMYAQADQAATFLNNRTLAQRIREVFRAADV